MRKPKIFPSNPNHLLMLLLGLWWLLNIIMGATLELADDEAYYWFIAKDTLSLGYFDHPPMFGLLTWLGVNIFGSAEIGVRFFAIMLQPLYLYMFWTLLRTEKSTWQHALTYFLIAFSIPQLQQYGFVNTPDAPLMMATALLLWSYKRYTEKSELKFAVLIGVSVALLAYSKYQGALIILFLVASNLKLLRQWKFWAAGALAAALIIPHLMWQYDHDWVSFRYHLSERNGVFSWGYIFEFLANVVGTFNPFVFVPFVIYQFRTKPYDSFDRTLRFIAWGFLGFFILSSLRGYVQPQWVLPIAFSILYTVFRSAEKYPRFNRYIGKVGLISFCIFFVFRIGVLFYDGQGIRFQTFNNTATYQAIADRMDGRTLLLDGHYAQASKMNYYSNGAAVAYPSVYRRSSQYQLMDLDDKLYGQKVAVAVNDYIRTNSTIEKLNAEYPHCEIANSRMVFNYDTINFYIPTRRVEITFPDPSESIKKGQTIELDMEIHNPYEYSIPLEKMILIAHFHSASIPQKDITLSWGEITELPARSRVKLKGTFSTIGFETGKYKLGLTIQRPPATSWYNSARYNITITE